LLATRDVGVQLVADKQYFIFAQPLNPHFPKAKSKNSGAGFRNPASTEVATHAKNRPMPALSSQWRSSESVAVRVFAQTASGNERKGNTSETSGMTGIERHVAIFPLVDQRMTEVECHSLDDHVTASFASPATRAKRAENQLSAGVQFRLLRSRCFLRSLL